MRWRSTAETIAFVERMYSIVLDREAEAGGLEYLNGKSFRVDKVDFVEEYFPGTKI